MRDALYRLTSPILDRIPDISHQPKSRQVSIGLAASLLFHLLLLLLAVIFGMVLPKHGLPHFAKPKPKLEEIEITVLPPVPAPVEEVRIVPLDEAKPFLDSRGLAASEKAPQDAAFQSGKDMRAASELPARGDAPLPSQDGRVSMHAPEFLKQDASVGKIADSAPPAEPAPKITPPTTPTAPGAPAPAAPTPMTDATKPTPLKQVPKAAEDEIALLATPKTPEAPTPAPDPSAIPKLRMRTTIPIAMNSATVPEWKKPERKYQPEQEPTQVDGNISNRGKKSVNAVGTPLGRYKEGVGNAVGSRWNFYVKGKGDMVALGSVRVRFTIDRKGRVSKVRTEDNTSNAAFATICERSVLEAELPPPSSDLSSVMRDGKLDMTFTFTLY